MKRFITCFIALILLLSVFGTNIYAENTEDEYLLRSLNALVALGIIEEEPTDIDAEEALSRQEAAIWLCNILKFDGEYETSIFNDVSAGTKSANAISALYDRNIVSGYQDGKFRPTETITYAEYVTMLLKMLNQGVVAEYYDGYPSGYVKQSYDIGLNKKVNKSANEKITVGDGAKILYNALDKDVWGWNGIFLEKYMDVYRLEGRVTADNKTSLTSPEGVLEGRIKIDETIYECTIPTEEWLGKYVTCYISEIDGREIVIHIENNKRYNELTINATDIIREESSRTTIVYEKEDKWKDINVSPVADIIYNGKAYPDAPVEDIFIQYGEIRALDSDDDSKYDVLFVWSYDVMVVKNIIAHSGTIYNKIEGSGILPSITIDKDAETDIIDSFGERLGMGDIALDNILLVAQSKTGSIPCYKIVVSDNIKTGEYDKKNEEYIWIDDIEYHFSDTIEKAIESGNIKPLDFNIKYDFYFDSFGNIVYYDAIYTGKQYGYLMRAYIDDSDESCWLKIFTSDGVWKRIELKDKVQYNSEVYKKEALIEIIDTELMIRYETNTKGLIKSIETARSLASDETERSRQIKNDVFRKSEMRDTAKNNKYFSMNKSFENAFFMGNNVKVFLIPTGENSSESDFACTDSTYFASETRYTADVYDVDEYMFTDLIVLEYDSSDPANLKFSNQDYCMMVTNTEEMWINDDVASYVSGLLKNEEWSYTSSVPATFEGLKKGDIIRTKYDPSGKLSHYVLVHRYGTEDQKSNSNNFNDSVYLYGNVLMVDYENDRMRIDEGRHLTVRTGSAFITVYDPEENDVRAGTIRDIEERDYVVLRMRSSLPFEIFVIKQ